MTNTPSASATNLTSAHKSLLFATIAFAIAFANWGMIAGMAPLLKDQLNLSVTQGSFMVAIPVLLGSLGRIPMGILTDRLGGRLVLSLLLIFALFPPLALFFTNHSYPSFLFWGLFVGLAGTSFAVGIAFISPFFSTEQQGTALGIYGVGNIGQSIAVFGGPVLAGRFGVERTMVLFGIVSAIWGAVFWLTCRNAPKKAAPRTFQENIKVLRTRKLSWILSFFYALTFGGFVALGIYLPTLYKELFDLPTSTGGALSATFVILATLSRPFGGWLSDRIGGKQLLLFVFLGLASIGWLLFIPSLIGFTLVVFLCAVMLGIGNGGVFKLVPQYFPSHTGTVTGLVGAVGGLGGFFPPIVLGLFKDRLGSYTPGFILFSLFALSCVFILGRTLLNRPTPLPVAANAP
jgi:MFS transporter, NNP family, nitrate/nitrite transporter